MDSTNCDLFSPCVKYVVSSKGYKMSTIFNRIHSRAVNNNSSCSAISRTAQSFICSHWRTAFTCPSVELRPMEELAGAGGGCHAAGGVTAARKSCKTGPSIIWC